MKTIKLIDLLVKMANKEEIPIKIEYGSTIYEFSEVVTNYVQNNVVLFDKYFFENCSLNDEVEIIEEIEKSKKIELLEKTDVRYDNPLNMMSYVKKEYDLTKENICDKLNEVIDKLNYLLENSVYSDEEMDKKISDYIDSINIEDKKNIFDYYEKSGNHE